MSHIRQLLSSFFGAMVFTLSGCGYHFQTSNNPLLKEGVRRIYVSPIVNNSYKAGVENTVYNALVRTLSSHGRTILVQNKADADAVLQGTVNGATYGPSGFTPVVGLNPAGFADLQALPTKSFSVATEYVANLSCLFELKRTRVPPRKKQFLWGATFSRSQLFPGANQLDVQGTTSALINESEFDRALFDLAHNMMDDVHESMLAMF